MARAKLGKLELIAFNWLSAVERRLAIFLEAPGMCNLQRDLQYLGDLQYSGVQNQGAAYRGDQFFFGGESLTGAVSFNFLL